MSATISPPETGLELVVNGRAMSIPADEWHTSLLDFLRARRLTGAKEGCAEGECGACAVAFVTPHGAGS
jgi:xanthine dehydrogenase small subunit